MYSLNQIGSWADHHHPRWLEFLRMILGLILIIKGISLIINKDQVMLMMEQSGIDVFSFLLSSQYVIAFYIAGGVLITIGLLTRVVVLLEIPTLIATIIFINYHQGLFALNSDLGYSILILFLLLFFLFYGSGTFSIDFLLNNKNEE